MSRKNNNKNLPVEDRVHNLEQLIWSLIISLALMGILYVYKIPYIWMSLVFIAILLISLGNFAVRFFVLTEIIGLFWGNATTSFVEKNRTTVVFFVQWITILSGIAVSKSLLGYDWLQTFGVFVLSVVANLVPRGLLELDKK